MIQYEYGIQYSHVLLVGYHAAVILLQATVRLVIINFIVFGILVNVSCHVKSSIARQWFCPTGTTRRLIRVKCGMSKVSSI